MAVLHLIFNSVYNVYTSTKKHAFGESFKYQID